MKIQGNAIYRCDLLVIGGGGAGIRAAIEAAASGADVVIASKTRVGYANNTYLSKSSIAATGLGDSTDNHVVHMQDTITGGRKINDRGLVERVVQDAFGQVCFLQDCGVSLFTEKGRLRIRHVPGHAHPRHVSGANWTGRDLTMPLKARAEAMGVRFFEKVFITALHASKGVITGASGLTENGAFITFSARCVILATGGFSRIYHCTNNAPGITGDGQALALKLGVPLKDMEFVQFYPTALGRHGNRLFLYESLVFQGGAILRNAQGENILVKHGINQRDLATRDRVAQAIMKEILEGRGNDGAVAMDLGEISENNVSKMASLLPASFFNGKRTFFVSPTAHFTMGGVSIGVDTETSVTGLFAAGEVCAGVHGANRLAGNALAESFVLGSVAGKSAVSRSKELDRKPIHPGGIEQERDRLTSLFSGKGVFSRSIAKDLKQVMWFNAGIVRHEKGLKKAIASIRAIKSDLCESATQNIGDLFRRLELENMLLVSEVVCRSALLRKESRGSHYRDDCPEENDQEWLCNITARMRGEDLLIQKSQVPEDRSQKC